MYIYIVISWWTVTRNTLEAQMKVLPHPSSAGGAGVSAARQFTQDTQSQPAPLKPRSAGRPWMIHGFSTHTKGGRAKLVCIIQDCILNKPLCSANCYNIFCLVLTCTQHLFLCTTISFEQRWTDCVGGHVN